MPEVSARTARTLDVPRLDTSTSFAKEAYAALKRAITAMDIYGQAQGIRLDERRLSEGLGVSRTPIREAMTLLEQEGFVRTRPRRGIYVVKKTKREIVEIITVMAALESMAARLAAERASDADVAELQRLMDEFRCGNGPGDNGGARRRSRRMAIFSTEHSNKGRKHEQGTRGRAHPRSGACAGGADRDAAPGMDGRRGHQGRDARARRHHARAAARCEGRRQSLFH